MTPRVLHRHRSCHRAILAIVALSFSACREAPSVVEGLPPLPTATWQMVLADGSPLPTVIAHRQLADGRLEQSVLESATLSVDATGRFEQHFRLRTVANGVQQSNVLVQDLGAWTALGDRYELTSDTRVRTFRVDGAVRDTLRTVEAMVFRAEAGLVRGQYVRAGHAPAVRTSHSPSTRDVPTPLTPSAIPHRPSR